MFSKLVTLAAVLAVVRATPFPDTPTDLQKAGGDCVVSWEVDQTGLWKTTYVELMAGPNLGMQHITSTSFIPYAFHIRVPERHTPSALGVVDATDPSNHSFTYPCPAVTPNSAIYFYQFTSPFAPLANTSWTTRFAIADKDGNTVAPANAAQPNGQKDANGKDIAWGNGALVDPSTAVAAPTDAGTKVAGAAAASGSGSAAASGSSSGSASAAPVSSSGAAAASGSAPASSAGAAAGASSSGFITSSGASPTGKTSVVASSAGSGASASASANSTNAAITMSRTPLFALGAVAAIAVVAL
jgi:hypothetical protein